MQLVRKFSLSPPTTPRDQMPLSDIFTKVTFRAISWTKKCLRTPALLHPSRKRLLQRYIPLNAPMFCCRAPGIPALLHLVLMGAVLRNFRPLRQVGLLHARYRTLSYALNHTLTSLTMLYLRTWTWTVIKRKLFNPTIFLHPRKFLNDVGSSTAWK